MIHFKINITRALSCGLLMPFLIMLMFAPSALAANGDGTGGGKSQPLALVSSTPASGQQGVQLPVVIKMTFSKNVVNMSVHDNNMNCFALYTSAGLKVPIEVVMADDQIYPEQREQVVLRPLNELRAGTGFVVRIAPELQAKSGATMDKEVDITFTTATSAAVTPVVQNKSPQPEQQPVQQVPTKATTSAGMPATDQGQTGSTGGYAGVSTQPVNGSGSGINVVAGAPQVGAGQIRNDRYDILLQGLLALLIALIVIAMVLRNAKRGRS